MQSSSTCKSTLAEGRLLCSARYLHLDKSKTHTRSSGATRALVVIKTITRIASCSAASFSSLFPPCFAMPACEVAEEEDVSAVERGGKMRVRAWCRVPGLGRTLIACINSRRHILLCIPFASHTAPRASSAFTYRFLASRGLPSTLGLIASVYA